MVSFVTPINLHTSCITLASKFVLLSDKKHSGNPNIGTSSSARSLAIHVAFLSGTANTSGHFVNRSWNTTTYLFPFAVNGNSIMSTPHISNRRCTGNVSYQLTKQKSNQIFSYLKTPYRTLSMLNTTSILHRIMQ